MSNNKSNVKIPNWLFLIPFAVVLTLEYFSKELTAGGLSKGTLNLVSHGLYIIAFIFIGSNWWQNKKNKTQDTQRPENMHQDNSYNTKKIITIIFLLLSFIVPVIGIVGVIFMWIWMKWKNWVKVVITIPFALIFIIGPLMIFNYLFLARPVQIRGQAMAPGYTNGQYYITSVFGKHFGIKRGDVIIHKSTIKPDIEMIHRVIAVQGDRLIIRDGVVYVNGMVLDEDKYISPGITTTTFQGGYAVEGVEIVIPQDSYFVLGDNRPKSSDSRVFGPIHSSSVISKVAFCYYNCQ